MRVVWGSLGVGLGCENVVVVLERMIPGIEMLRFGV